MHTRLSLLVLAGSAMLMAGCNGAVVTLWNELGTGSDPVHMVVSNIETAGEANRLTAGQSRDVRVPWGRTSQGQIVIEVTRGGETLEEGTCTVFTDKDTPIDSIYYFPSSGQCSPNPSS